MFGSWKPKATSVHHQSFGASSGHSKTVLDSSEKQRDEPKMSQHVATRVAWICVWCILQFFGHRPASTFQGGWCSAYRKRHVAVLVQEICMIKLIDIEIYWMQWMQCFCRGRLNLALERSRNLKRHGSWRCHVNRPWRSWKQKQSKGSEAGSLPTETLFVTFGYVRLEECEECCTIHHFGKY